MSLYLSVFAKLSCAYCACCWSFLLLMYIYISPCCCLSIQQCLYTPYPSCLTHQYSGDADLFDDVEHQQIIRAVVVMGKTKAKVAKYHNWPYSTISAIIQTFLNTGQTQSRKKTTAPSRNSSSVNEEHINIIVNFVNN